MLIKPAAGREVRDPVRGTLLPETGATVTLSAFWRRRLRDGDVEEVTASTAEAATADTTAADTTTATADSTSQTTTATTDDGSTTTTEDAGATS